MINAGDLLGRKGRLLNIEFRQLPPVLSNLGERRSARPISLGERISRYRVLTGENEEPFPGMRKTEVMWRDQAMAARGYVCSSTDMVAKVLETLANDSPRAPIVVALEVADILEKNVRGTSGTENRDYLVKQRPSSAVLAAVLVAGLGEGLARKSCTKEIMRRNLFFGEADIPEDNLP